MKNKNTLKKNPWFDLERSGVFSFLKYEVWDLYVESLRGVEYFYGVEIDERTIKVARLETKDEKIINGSFQVEPLAETTPQAIFSALNLVLTKLKYKGEDIYITLTGRDILNKIIKIEETNFKSTEEWILRNKDKIFPPVKEEDLLLDYKGIGGESAKKLLFLSFVRKENIDPYLGISKERQLNFKALSSGSLPLYSYLQEEVLIPQTGDCILILFKGNSTEITIYQETMPVFVTYIPPLVISGNSSLDDNKQGIEVFIKDLRQILDFFYQDKDYKNPKLLFLGNKDVSSKLKPYLREQEFALVEEPAIKGSDQLVIPQTHITPYLLAKEGVNPTGYYVDFQPPQSKPTVMNLRSLQKVLSYGVRIFLIPLLIFGIMSISLTIYESLDRPRVEKFEIEMQELKTLEEQNNVLEEKWQARKNILSFRSRKSELLSKLSELSPEGIWLRNITIETEETKTSANRSNVEIGGLSLSQEAVTEFLSALERSDGFSGIKLASLDKAEGMGLQKIPKRYINSVYKFRLNFISVF